MIMYAQPQWIDVVGLAGFAANLSAIKGAVDPCTRWSASGGSSGVRRAALPSGRQHLA